MDLINVIFYSIIFSIILLILYMNNKESMTVYNNKELSGEDTIFPYSTITLGLNDNEKDIALDNCINDRMNKYYYRGYNNIDDQCIKDAYMYKNRDITIDKQQVKLNNTNLDITNQYQDYKRYGDFYQYYDLWYVSPYNYNGKLMKSDYPIKK